ncbi:hypothetical protein DQM68_14980 [Leptospira mayottensis]|uniref:Uncharacterized protein n=2 Tax=Leptospira mayottensis TaxID=1137606 RepID=A0AA87MS50_9LEPT|nr:hypothetical protein DQM68_14980 [Leptospira mayottensis]AZQ01765.1 hypothetical protein LEP1GSC190_06740 [Leptospira mayottensis 200901116]EKS00855.1 hypothetical protein LEP1GSC125_2166 [Leptospira mayottensis 200901122]AXR64918.1 hypothetical protein DQM28_12530 [Leptospira mayottensis]AXR69367.1 hypothetical protein DPV73_16390 [Leptospira mayottensis]
MNDLSGEGIKQFIATLLGISRFICKPSVESLSFTNQDEIRENAQAKLKEMLELYLESRCFWKLKNCRK